MPNAPETADMTVDRHVVGRVAEYEIGLVALHQPAERCFVARVSADQPMPSQQPDVSRTADCVGQIPDGLQAIIGIVGRRW
jgi:hypothetical protein